MSLFLLDIHVFCIDGQGAEGSSAVLIEGLEKFQALQAQVVDVAAQQVQREVQGVAHHGDEHEGDHVASDAAQSVEHAGDDAAGEHQGHEPGVGEHVAENAGGAVVDRAHEGPRLADALGVPGGAVDQHEDAGDEDHRIPGHVAHAQDQQPHAQVDDPPGALVPDPVPQVAVLGLLHEAHDLSGDDLDEAQHQGAHQDGHGVLQRREQGRQGGEGGVRVDDGGQLGQEVPEEAAGHGPHHKGADPAVEQQLREVPHPASGPHLFDHKGRAQHHQQPVPHVRHHDPVEQDEEGGHQGVGVHGAVHRQGVHLRDHVHAPGQRSVAQLHRHLGVLLRRRVRQLPGAVEAAQDPLQLRDVGRVHPPVQAEDAASRQEPLLGLLRGQDLLDLIHAQLQRPGLRPHGPDGVQLRLSLGPDRLQLALQPPDVLPGGARRVLELGKAEAVGPQDLQRRALLGAVDHHLQALLLLVGGQQRHLGRLRRLRHGASHGIEVHGAGHRAQKDRRVPGPRLAQGQLAGFPGPQAQDLGVQPGLPGGALAGGLGVVVHRPGLLQRRGHGPPVQQVSLPDLRPRRQKALLLGGVLAQGGQGLLQLRQLALGLRHPGLVPDEQGVGLVRRRLADLHAARVEQAGEQSVPIPGQGDEPQPFHLDNGHQLSTTFSKIAWTALSMRLPASALSVSQS